MSDHDPAHERPLPLDADIEADEGAFGRPLPIHLSPRFLALVAMGGSAGCLARHVASDALGAPGRFPVGTFTVNVVGALLLGVLLEALARHGDNVGRRRALRLLLGTGFLGGFTTYSALSVDTDQLLRAGSPLLAVSYAFGTLLAGLAATIAGIALARRMVR